MSFHFIVLSSFISIFLLQPQIASTAPTTQHQCAWPCPRVNDVCIFNPNTRSSNCQPLVNAQWIIMSPDSPPVFYDNKITTSSFATLGEECQLYPPSSTSSSHSQSSSLSEHSKRVCAPGLECFIHSNGSSTCELSSSSHYQQRKRYKREDGNAFSKTTHHTTAFNVVHVIAAVLGIAGAALVSITTFIMCRRRQRRLARERRQTASTTLSNNDIQETSMHRFNQFAQDYHHDEEDYNNQPQLPPKTHQPTTDKEPLVSPSMQQIHLHRQLLERHQQSPLPPPPYYP